MGIFYTLLFIFSSFSASAEIIGNVNYNLPSNWEIGNQYKNQRGTTLIYIPKGNEGDNITEFFGVSENNLKMNLNDNSIKETLVKLLPSMQIDLKLLEKSDHAILYEWSAKEGGEEKIHGIGRAFSKDEGTIVLSYQTDNIASLDQSRTEWLQLLKEAHIK